MFRITTATAAAVVLTAVAAPATSQTMIDQLIGKVTKRKTAPSASPAAGANVASVTPAQTAEIDRLLSLPIQDAKIVADRQQAMPLIRRIVATGACARNELAWNALNREALEPKNWVADGGVVSFAPMRLMRYHDAANCLDAVRIVGWRKPALNSVAFRVFYVAADSGEAGNQEYVLQKDSAGQWLIRKVDLVTQ